MEVKSGLNDAEEFVYKVCCRSFLSLWSYANPQGKDGSKELCDILIICEPDIVIFSVKDIKLTDSGDESVDWERWRRKAVEASVKQIYGAERFLKQSSHITRSDGTQGLSLSKEVEWRFHRVAVAIGSQGKVPFQFGDFEKGFVHVFDETSFRIIVQELDTISDFVDYLAAKERMYESGVATLLQGAEEDLLALYLHGNRKFPDEPDALILDPNLWHSFSKRNEVQRRKEDDRDSYVWDWLIEEMCNATPDMLELGPTITQDERIVRTMARENRFSRRMLGLAYKNLLSVSKDQLTRSRLITALSGVAYVLVYGTFDDDLKYEQEKLYCRCFIARGMLPDCKTIIGISTAATKSDDGWRSQLFYLHMPDWTQEDQSLMEKMQEETGFFKSPVRSRLRGDEFPQSNRDNLRIELLEPNAICPCGSGKQYKKCHGHS